MFPIKKINESLKKYVSAENLFDLYRIVDPLSHKELDLKEDGELTETGNLCHDVWERGMPCQNCISMHTCNEQKQYFKMEFINDTVYLIFSLPVTLNNKKYALELIKDVTSSMFLANRYNDDKTEAIMVIDKFNEIAVRDVFTGLYNKKYAYDQLQKFSSENNSEGSMFGLMVDIDGLMDINNEYGHHIGDIVLKRLSAVLFSLSESPLTFAARIKNDNFCLFFRDIDISTVKKKEKKFLDLVETLIFEKDDKAFHVSVSTAIDEVKKGDSAQEYMNRLNALLNQS